MIKLSARIIVLSEKMEHLLKTCIGNGTIELRHGTATPQSQSESRAAASAMTKRQNSGAMQQRVQPKRDISSIASWLSHSK